MAMKKTGIKRRSPIKRKKRTSSEFSRIYGSNARVRWVASLPCIVCGGTPCENAHTENGGMSRKAGYQTVAPLCTKHHRYLHDMGVATFGADYLVDLKAAAAEVESLWLARTDEDAA